MTSKIRLAHNIMLIDNSKVIVERDLVEAFNDLYINIVEKSSGEKPRKNVLGTNLLGIDMVIDEQCNIWDKVFKNGPSKICGRQRSKHLK